MSKEVIVKQQGQVAVEGQMNERQCFILAAMDRAGGPDQLEKVLATYERMESIEAKKAYTSAMTEFKANPPKIVKDKHVSFNQTNYKHASLANVTDKVNSALASHGLASFWETNHKENGEICVTTRITHKMGHSESTTICAAPDNSGKKNAIQQIGSTITYLQRYGLMSLCGLAAHDDDDGIGSSTINEKQVSTIVDLMANRIKDSGDFFSWASGDRGYTITSAEDILSKDYGHIVTAIKSAQVIK